VQISKQNTVIRDIKGSLERWFSSTRPELRAILDAILIAPSGSKVTINTDSKAAIGAIQSSLNTNKARAWFRTTNSTILSAIKEAVASKEIQLCLIKVKAHSGLIWNDRADRLAKEGLDSDLISESKEITSRGRVYKPLWQNTSIEVPLRDFIKKVTNTIYKVEWTLLRANKDQRHRDRLGNKDWSVFRLLLRKIEKAQSKTIKEDLRRSFVLKCINRALPTLEKRKIQRPDLYSSAICIKCLEEVETFEHLTECSQDEILWLEGEKNIVEDIWTNLVPESERDFSELALHEALIPEAHKKTIWRSKLARGILENQFRENLRALGLSKNKARTLLSNFLEKWLIFFQSSIWKKRCSRIIEWEKTLNIKLQDKRKKKAKKKSQGKEKRAGKKSVVSEEECINIKEKKWNQTLKSAFEEISKWIEKGSFSVWNSG
jgi:ribonuclease HI